MLDYLQGASPDPDARLRGEILAALSTWTADYELERLELGWTVLQMLLQHIAREQPIDVHVEFMERAGLILSENAQGMRDVVWKECRKEAH